MAHIVYREQTPHFFRLFSSFYALKIVCFRFFLQFISMLLNSLFSDHFCFSTWKNKRFEFIIVAQSSDECVHSSVGLWYELFSQIVTIHRDTRILIWIKIDWIKDASKFHLNSICFYFSFLWNGEQTRKWSCRKQCIYSYMFNDLMTGIFGGFLYIWTMNTDKPLFYCFCIQLV